MAADVKNGTVHVAMPYAKYEDTRGKEIRIVPGETNKIMEAVK